VDFKKQPHGATYFHSSEKMIIMRWLKTKFGCKSNKHPYTKPLTINRN